MVAKQDCVRHLATSSTFRRLTSSSAVQCLDLALLFVASRCMVVNGASPSGVDHQHSVLIMAIVKAAREVVNLRLPSGPSVLTPLTLSGQSSLQQPALCLVRQQR